MKSQARQLIQSPYYKVNNFIDYLHSDGRFYECQIYQVQQLRLYIKSIRQEMIRIAVDIISSRLKPYRLMTKPSEFVTTYHKYYAYWGDGFFWSLQSLKKIHFLLHKFRHRTAHHEDQKQKIVKQSEQIQQPAQRRIEQKEIVTTVQIIQTLKGKNFYSLLSLNDDKRINEGFIQKILQYVKQFLNFFILYWDTLEYNQMESKKIYESPRNALMMSYTQIFINLTIILTRRSYVDQGSNKQIDRVLDYSLEWLYRKLIPRICEKSLQNINYEIAVRLSIIFIKLTGSNRIARSQKTEECIQKLLTHASKMTNKISFNKFTQQFQLIMETINHCCKVEKQFTLALKCKLHLLLRYQQLVYETNLLPNVLMKHMGFILNCTQYPELKDLALNYIHNENGLSYFVKNINMSSNNLCSSELLKLSRVCSEQFIKQCAKARKLQILKNNFIQWNFRLIKIAITSFNQVCKTNDKQQLVQSKQMHKIIANQIKALCQIRQQPNQNLEKFRIQKKEAVETVKNHERRIIYLAQALFDGAQKTPLIDYIQKSIIPKYLEYDYDSIIGALDNKQTNIFREKFIFKQFFKRYTLLRENISGKNLFIICFVKLCKVMTLLKGRPLLQQRRQILFSMLSKIINTFPQQFTLLFCYYIESVKKVHNKQFKMRALEQFTLLIRSKANLFKNQQDKITKFKTIIDAMKIQNFNQYKTFMYFFGTVGNYQNTIKINDQNFVPLVLYRRPYGIQKIYQVYKSQNNEKMLLKKLQLFFSKIHLKFVDLSQKSQFIQQLTNKLVQFLGIHANYKYQITKNDYDFIAQIKQLLQLLLVSHQDLRIQDILSPDYDYSKLFIDKNDRNVRLNRPMSFGNIQSQSKFKVTQENIGIQGRISYNQSDKQRQTKNSKIKVTVLFQNQSIDKLDGKMQEQSICKVELRQINSNSMEEQDKKIQNEKFELYVERDERLYSIKSKAASKFQISPLTSSFFLNQKQIQHYDQSITVESTLQLSNPIQKQQEQNLVLSLKQHPRQNTARQTLLKNLDILYLCLPYTQKLWNSLQVGPEKWMQEEKLIELKQSFIRYEPQQESYSQMVDQDRSQLSTWSFIMDDHMRKRIIIQALLNDNHLNLGQIKWLFSSLTEMRIKADIINNIQFFRLIQRSQKQISKQQAQNMLQKIKIVQKQLSHNEMIDIKEGYKLYENLLRGIFLYIEQHSKFCFFTFLIKLDNHFFSNINSCDKFNIEFGYVFVKSFIRYVEKNLQEFLQVRLLEYLIHYQKSFKYFVQNLQKSHHLYQNKALLNSLNLLLKKSVDLIIEDSRFNTYFDSYIEATNILLHIIASMMSKGLKCDSIINSRFQQIINKFLYSKLCNQTIFIISCIVASYPSEGQKYIEYFRKEMDEPQWERKDYIKFINKYNLRHQSGFIGLKNPHSICYVNSLLQQLFHIKPFREQLYLTKWKKNSSVEQDLILQLKKIFINLQYRQCDSYFNFNFFDAFKNDQGSATSTEVQMDVDQFRSILFDRIQNLIIKPQNQGRNFVQNIFNGKQLTIVKSKQCEHQSTRQEQFSSICLQVKGLKKLQNSLEHYFKPEILNEDNMYFCQDCNKKVIAQKTNQIKQYPRYLTFVLKRFEYSYQYRKKINERFQFPLNFFKIVDSVYNLKGIIVHQGLSEAGHYFSLIKINGKWYEFNDNSIGQIFSQQEVINLSYGQFTAKSNRNAYLLIYQRQQHPGTTIKQQNATTNMMPLQYGLDQQIADIYKYNSLLWKAELFFSEEFQNFIQTAVKEKVNGSVNLLYQYITTIKVKCSRPQIKSFKPLFELLQKNVTSNLLDSQEHVSWALQFYKNSSFNPSFKPAMTKILVKNYERFDEYLKKFLKMCILFIHQQIQTSSFYHLFLQFAKKNHDILKYLVDARIIGRIFDFNYTHLLLTIDRTALAQSTDIPFTLIEINKLTRKKGIENSQLRYHKWKLINYILRQNIELHKIQLNYIQQWNERKSHSIFQQAVSKSIINQISKYFCFLTEKNQTFGDIYLKEVCQQVSKDRSQHLRKYLKAAADLLSINDSFSSNRRLKIKNTFVQTFKMLHKQKIMSSFDVKWQWFVKIGFTNPQFRRLVRSSIQQFKIINTKSELQSLYLSRIQINSQGKYKNKYYGLKFSSNILSSSNNNFLDDKFQKSRLMFFGDEHDYRFIQISRQYAHFDTDLTDFPEYEITQQTTILKFAQQISRFKQVQVDQSLGDFLEVQGNWFDRGDERLMHCFERTVLKKQQEPQEQNRK